MIRMLIYGRGGDKIDKLRGHRYAPFKVEFVEDKLVVTDYYNSNLSKISEIKIGDVITHINNTPVEDIVDSLKPYYPSSNKAAMLRDMSEDLLRSKKQTINIRYISSQKNKQKELSLYDTSKLNRYRWYKKNTKEKSYNLLENNIGYVTLASIKDEDIPEIKKVFKNTDGIIIDIRNYPSTPVVYSLDSYFVSTPTPFVKFTQGSIYNPGEFIFTTSLSIPIDKEVYKGKLVVLVNENTQSQAEFTAMAFRAGVNTTIIGSTTAGADGDISTILLPGGLKTWISGIGVYYPDGTETQRAGIVPDITVKRTILGVRNGEDEVLEKAIEIISN